LNFKPPALKREDAYGRVAMNLTEGMNGK
jgi:hypothetical protein